MTLKDELLNTALVARKANQEEGTPALISAYVELVTYAKSKAKRGETKCRKEVRLPNFYGSEDAFIKLATQDGFRCVVSNDSDFITLDWSNDPVRLPLTREEFDYASENI